MHKLELSPQLSRFYWVVLIIVVGMGLSITDHYQKAAYLNRPYPKATFLYRPDDHFNDYRNIVTTASLENPYTAPLLVYFPSIIPVLKGLHKLPGQGLAIFIIAFIVSCLGITYHLLQFLPRPQRLLGTFLLGYWNYFSLFVLDRLNFEILVFWGIAYFLLKENTGESKKGVLGLAFATSLKLFPGLLALHYLVEKRFRDFLLFLLAVGVFTAAGLLMIEAPIALTLAAFQKNLKTFQEIYYFSSPGLQHNLSLPHAFYLVGTTLENLKHLTIGSFFVVIGKSFWWTNAIWVLMVYAIFRSRHLRFYHKALFAILITILLPPVSFDYKGIHLLCPFLAILGDSEKKYDRLNFTLAILLALVFIPKDYFIIRSDISMATLLNPALMCLCLFHLIKFCRETRQNLS